MSQNSSQPEVDDASSADLVLNKFDSLIAQGGSADRVSFKFCGDAPGTMRKDLSTLARTGSWSMRLRSEITAYQCCILDDSFAEGPHAVTTKTCSHSSASTPPWWSATARIEQNKIVRGVLEQMHPGLWSRCMQFHRSIFQMDRRALLHHKRGNMPARNEPVFFQKVYRVGRFAATPVESIQAAERDFCDFTAVDSAGSRPPPLTNITKMLKQYWMLSLKEGSVYSFQPSDNPDGSRSDLLVFQIVELFADRYKINRTASEDCKRKSLKVPIIVQPLEVVSLSRSSCSPEADDALEVSALESPKRVDLRSLGGVTDSMKSLLHNFIQWDSHLGDEGKLLLSAPKRLDEQQWITYLISTSCR